MRAMISDGRSALSSSQPSPHDSSTPGRKFSITTSHIGTRRRTISWPFRRVQVERDHLLAAVVLGEPVVDAVFRGPEPAQVVALAGQLGLDHLGAELGHERAAKGPGDDLGQLEHADAGERQGAIGHGERAAL